MQWFDAAAPEQRRQALLKVVGVFEDMALRPKTRASYDSLTRAFHKWCDDFAVSPYKALAEEDLCAAAIWFCRTHKFTSLKNYVAAIRDDQLRGGLGELQRGHKWERVKSGLSNFYSLTQEVEKKLALSVDQLRAISAIVDPADPFESLCWFATLVAWHALLRVGEYCDGRLRWCDIAPCERGIAVNIRFDKVKLKPREVCIVAWPSEPALCVVAAYNQFMKSRGGAKGAPGSPLLVCGKSVLSKKAYITRLKHWASAACGIQEAVIAGHSLRRGGTTALTQAGVPEMLIQHHGRWESFTNREYIHFVGALAWEPSARLRAALCPTGSQVVSSAQTAAHGHALS